MSLDYTARVAGEHRLNEAVSETFRTRAGQVTLAWLRTLAIETVVGPDRPDSELRHHEGMRHLVKLIETRIHFATEGKPPSPGDHQ